MNLAVKQDLIASSDNRVVIGLGVTGLSCARFLRERDLPFSVVDTREAPPGLDDFRRAFPDVSLFLGEVPSAVIEGATELVVSPGVAMDDPLVEMGRGAGVDIVGDIDLFVREARAPVIGITGSNAKSTVTELLGQMAREAAVKVAVGGNLGVPALDLLSPENELYVLELSSFQLERAGQLRLAVATVLNVTADHLDRHGSMPLYHRAKHRIFFGCQRAVVNRDDPLTIPLVAEDVKVTGWRMSEPGLGDFGLRVEAGIEYLSRQFELLMPVSELGLPGRHNVANALAALALGDSAGLPMEAMLRTLREFRGLPHRCQLVLSRSGVDYVNDSKGTNVGATEAALAGLGGDHNVLLIAGGEGKGADFEQLLPAVRKHCKAVLVIGEASEDIAASLGDCVEILRAGSLEQAVEMASAQAVPGDIVLLSPACASFDMFSGYAQRGEVFSAAVLALPEASR